MNVTVTELRRNLPSYLKRVRQGLRVQVTSRGQIIAVLIPPTSVAEDAVRARKRLRGSLVRNDKPFAAAVSPKKWTANEWVLRDNCFKPTSF